MQGEVQPPEDERRNSGRQMRWARETPQVNYVETSCYICKMGIQNVLRLLRDQRIKYIAGCLEELALRTSSLPPPSNPGVSHYSTRV